jgi:hypothetical protein
MQLRAALGTSLVYTRGDVPNTGATWKKALEIAESLGDVEYQLRSLWGLWGAFHIRGQHSDGVGLTLAQRFYELAANRSDRNDCLIGERMIATSAAAAAPGMPCSSKSSPLMRSISAIAQRSSVRSKGRGLTAPSSHQDGRVSYAFGSIGRGRQRSRFPVFSRLGRLFPGSRANNSRFAAPVNGF